MELDLFSQWNGDYIFTSRAYNLEFIIKLYGRTEQNIIPIRGITMTKIFDKGV